MKKKFKVLRRVGTAALIGLLMSSVAHAALQVTFPWSLNPGQVQYFWGNDSDKSASATGRTPASTTGSPSETVPSKPDTTPPSTVYGFWSGDVTNADSQCLGIRVWSDATKADGSIYTEFWGKTSYATPYNNDASSPGSATFDKAYRYVKTSAGQAVISSYVESKTVTNPTSPSPTLAGTITFNSAQPMVGSYEVQIKSTQWYIDGVADATTQSMAKTASYFTSGTTYAIKVKHMSYWGSWGTDSAVLSYTSSGGVGGSSIFNIAIRRLAGGAGINSFSVPNDTSTISNAKKDGVAATVTTTSVSNALQLCEAINQIQGGACVRTFGYWDEVAQKASGVVLEYSGSSLSMATATQLSGIALQKGRGYQVYVKPDSDTAVNITFDLQ